MRVSMSKRLRSRLITALLFGSSVVAAAAQGAPTACTGTLGQFGWQCVTVDASGDEGSLSQLAYASDGTPLIAYTQILGSKGLQSVTALRYATTTATDAWSIQTIDPKVGGPSALQLNPVTRNPAISYGCLKLAEFTGSSWALQTVVAKGCGNWGGTFAYDQGGSAFAAYTDTKKRLVLGERIGSTWTFQTSNQLASSYKSMAVGPDGQPSIAFENFGTALVFGRRTPEGTWQFTVVDPAASGDSGFISHVNLVYDEGGDATIAYKNGLTIRYARFDIPSGTWTVEVVHASPGPGWYLSASTLTQATGGPVIAFQQYNDSSAQYELMVNRKTNGTWTAPSTVETFPSSNVLIGTSVGYHPGLDTVGISYGPRGSISDLRFAEGPASVIGQ